jgi:hypothetical protein
MVSTSIYKIINTSFYEPNKELSINYSFFMDPWDFLELLFLVKDKKELDMKSIK